jgi:hypothetical protein
MAILVLQVARPRILTFNYVITIFLIFVLVTLVGERANNESIPLQDWLHFPFFLAGMVGAIVAMHYVPTGRCTFTVALFVCTCRDVCLCACVCVYSSVVV